MQLIALRENPCVTTYGVYRGDSPKRDLIEAFIDTTVVELAKMKASGMAY